MGYRVHAVEDKFKVVEVKEGEVKDIETNLTEEKAKAMARALNFGGGFNGNTPDFFLARLEVSV